MAQTTIQGSFLGDGTVTGVKIGADFISAQTELASGLATADEIIVSDAGVIKRMDISVWSAATITFTNKSIDLDANTLTGTIAEFNAALQSESFATLGGTETLAAKTLTTPTIASTGWTNALHAHAANNSGGTLDASVLGAGTIPDGRFPSTLPAASGVNLTALAAANITASGTLPALNGAALTALNGTQVTSGTVPVAQLGSSGTRSSSTFLNGANAWAAAGVTDISCRLYHNAAQDISNNVDTRLVWNQESYDTDTMHGTNTASDTHAEYYSKLTAITPGKYMILCNVQWAPNTTGYRNHYIQLNRTTTIAMHSAQSVGAPTKLMASFSTVWDLSEDDYIEVKVAQNSGTMVQVNNDEGSTFFAMYKIN